MLQALLRTRSPPIPPPATIHAESAVARLAWPGARYPRSTTDDQPAPATQQGLALLALVSPSGLLAFHLMRLIAHHWNLYVRPLSAASKFY